MRVAGVDGTKGGWVAIELEDGEFAADRLIALESDFHELARVEVIAVDIPIGFGPRQADGAARRFLGSGASSVFITPSEEILRRPFRSGLGVSAQAYALGGRIIRITELARRDRRFHEVHPEVSFQAMNDGHALGYRKKCAGGAFARLDLLAREGIVLDGVEHAANAPLHDVVDAAAAAWTAHRIAAGVAESLPDPPEAGHERELAIWY
jgi:predicted RNase H-like nuclease